MPTFYMCEKANMATTIRRVADFIENKQRSGAVDIDDLGAGGKALRRMLRSDLKEAIEMLKKMDREQVK